MITSQKQIQRAIEAATGYQDVKLSKVEGFYYWYGNPICDLFDDRWTGYRFLNDVSLERWVSDFTFNLEQIADKEPIQSPEIGVIRLVKRIS